jgi:hypothetical protein
MRAAEDRRVRSRSKRDADPGNDLREMRPPSCSCPPIGQSVRALVPHVLQTQARGDRPSAEHEPVLHKSRIRLILSLVVFDQNTRARRRRLTVHLLAILSLEVRPKPEFGLSSHAKEPVESPESRLDAPRVVLAHAPFVPARRQKIFHASTARIAPPIRTLIGIARLTPPVPEKQRAVDVRRQHEFVPEHIGMRGGNSIPISEEPIVQKRILPRVGQVFVEPQP